MYHYQSESQQAGNNLSKMADFVVQFALKIKRLVALCIVSPLLDGVVMQDIRSRIEEKVVPVRKALWFHIGDEWPIGSTKDVPGIHYNEMIEPVFYFPPPF